jgi:hypothetical protein
MSIKRLDRTLRAGQPFRSPLASLGENKEFDTAQLRIRLVEIRLRTE